MARRERGEAQEDDYHVAQEESHIIKKECNDVFFLIVFLAAIITTIVFAGKYGSDFIEATKIVKDVGSTAIEATGTKSAFEIILKYVFLSTCAAAGMSILWIVLMILAGEFLIWLALGVIIILNILTAYFFTKELYGSGEKYYYWPAIVFGLFALLTILYVCCIRKRIKFAAAHLKVAGNAIFCLPMTLIVAAVMVCLQVGWAITWTLGSVGILFHQEYIKISDICTIDKCEIDIITGPSLGIMFFFFLIFFWGATVLKNIIAVTVSGTVASWKLASNSPLITISAWLRAMTLSLGSICFGSLIVAILEAVRQVLNILTSMAKDSGNCCAACLMGCLSCMIGCVERLVEFFNRFAYAYIGYYGYSFVTASKHVFQLFRDKGWSAIINDDLTQNVFFLGNIIIGAITAYIGIELVKGTDDPNQLRIFGSPEAIIAFFAFCSGYAINNLLMSVIASAVTTVFVLWAEDPHGWQLTRPEAYHALHQAWLEIYPEEYNNGYGKIRNNGQNFDRF